MNKKAGDEKYYIIISLILGILILMISLYFIFQEYFNEDDLSWEACRQSIVMRASVPGYSKISSVKDLLPLKCKTQVYTPKKGESLSKSIQTLIESCESLTGDGQYEIFPVGVYEGEAHCFPCLRIHLTPELKKEFGFKDDLMIYYYYRSPKVPLITSIVLNPFSILAVIGLDKKYSEWYAKTNGAGGFVNIMDLVQFSEMVGSNQCKLEGVPA